MFIHSDICRKCFFDKSILFNCGGLTMPRVVKGYLVIQNLVCTCTNLQKLYHGSEKICRILQ